MIRGVPLAGDALEALATRLKKRCGSGGTVEAGVIEIQGDHRDLLVAELGKLGYTVKRVGRLRRGRMRLNKYLAETGACSRRVADQWIEAGRVRSMAPRPCSARRSTPATKCCSTADRWPETRARLPRAQQAGRHRVHDRSRGGATTSWTS